jgi:hypothetical protein
LAASGKFGVMSGTPKFEGATRREHSAPSKST